VLIIGGILQLDATHRARACHGANAIESTRKLAQ
jgi:hypothetical protein